jgi:light-regulated signal transduction histidine kinase (bacteriophytochrome)
LEAFTYSVSHDLRAPLRAIHGYTKILEEEFLGKIDDDAKRMMDGVMNNAKKMGQLIDDLLALSRLGKKELVKKNTDLTGLMTQSLNELKKTMDTSKAKITIDTLGSAMVDPALMQQVFINLLNNAVKYSSLKEHPEIHVGVKTDSAEKIYYVKDNGTGFDMQYYNKLFGVFQRLHDSYEFEGTGVGLALVKRIITRHGGKIWAEAEVDKGATFYFTLNS